MSIMALQARDNWRLQSSHRFFSFIKSFLPIAAVFAAVFALAPSGTAQTSSAVATAVAELRDGRAEEAILTVNAALKVDRQNYKLWSLKGIALDQESHPQEALVAFAQALRLAPDYLPALQGYAQISYRLDEPSKAVPLLQRLLALHPQDTKANAMLGVLEYRQQQYAAAAGHFRSAQVASSNDKLLLQQFGASLVQQRAYAEALSILSKLLAMEPENRDTRYNLALDQFLGGTPKTAAQTLEPLLIGATSENEVFSLGADISLAQGDIKGAVELLRRAMQQYPDNVDNYLQFTAMANDGASFRTGIAVLDLGIARLPGSAALHLARGVLYSQLADYDKAVADFARANELNPRLAVVDAAKGVMESQQKKNGAALETFRLAARQRPNDALTQFLLAEALSEQGPAEGGSDHKEEIAKEEIAAANRAVKLDPTLVAARDLLAGFYLQRGQSDLAGQQSKLALEQNPNDQQAIYHLILALRKGDRKAEVPILVKRLTELRRSEADAHPHYHLTMSQNP
jgi:tetratricopeptide (TPR) repeat protein